MFDIDKIEDFASDLMNADAQIRKSMKLHADLDNPGRLLSKLAGLARAASSAAQSISIVMSNEREREFREVTDTLPSWATEMAREIAEDAAYDLGARITIIARALLSTYQQGKQDGQREALGTGWKFQRGDRVTKIKGSSWTGHVVGFYSTSLTPIGYAVESEAETGSVQIYPEAAIRRLDEVQNDA